MVTRVWGSINSQTIEFERVPDRDDYWEGIGPRSDDYQMIEIWAETNTGAIAHVDFAISMKIYGSDKVRLLLSPYRARIVEEYTAKLVKEAV